MRYRLLGQLEVVTGDGRVVAFAGDKERIVLAALLMRANRAVSTSHLIDALWGDDPPERAANALQVHVSRLRKKLAAAGEGDEVLFTEPSGYRLGVGPGELDVACFEELVASATGGPEEVSSQLAEALAVWKGPALSGVDSDALAGEAVRLEELRLVALERRIEADLALGRHLELVPELEAVIADHSLREGLRRQLMVALYRCDRQADALALYRQTRDLLADQLGIEPSPALQALELDILNQSPKLAPTHRAVAAGSVGMYPFGTVTFLFSDVEGSARLSQELGSERYGNALREHRARIREVVAAYQGAEVDTEADALFVAFDRASDAVGAALAIQEGLGPGPIGVRIGLHTGEPLSVDRTYAGVDVHLAARICSAGHGGQVLLSSATARLARHVLPADASLADRGEFLFRGVDEPERVYQLLHPVLWASFPPLRAAPAQSHNLPDTRTSFVGREGELKLLDDLLVTARLVSVVGPGGSGKTRLAVELAARVAARFESGAFLCDLSPFSDPARVASTVAGVFAVQDAPGVDPLDALAWALEGRQVLLLVDNCEHVLEAAGAAIDRLLAAAAGVTVLATSREPLGVDGEQVWRIGPLSVPGIDATVEGIVESDAVRLFANRGQLAQAAFEVTARNAAAVADICRQVDGLPLAIELGAAQVASLTPAVIAQRLADHLQVHRAAPGRRPGRQRTLEATIEWSYKLLNDDQRRLLRFLSLFANGFPLDAATSVGDCDDPVSLLGSLVDKSLVLWDPDSDRYRLLETVRAFARARLDEAGEGDIAGARHLGWCVSFAESLGDYWTGPHDVEGYLLIDRELDNIRAAVGWAVGHQAPDAGRLAAPLGAYWCLGRRTPTVEARNWLARMAEIPGARPVDIGNALSRAALIAIWLDDHQTAWAASQRAIDTLTSAGDEEALELALSDNAILLVFAGRADEARAKWLELRDQAAERSHTFSLLLALNNLCWLETRQGNLADAVAYGRAGLEQTSENASLSMGAVIRATLAEALLEQGQATGPVIEMIAESLHVDSRLRGVSYLATNMTLLAKALAPTDPRSAAVLIGAARAMEKRHGIGHGYQYADRDYVDRLVEQLRNRLGDEELTEALESINEITFDEATDLAISLARRWNDGMHTQQPAAGSVGAGEYVPQPM
jgi:predicted ATPase/DNA-binding SARP family transcriptional activator